MHFGVPNFRPFRPKLVFVGVDSLTRGRTQDMYYDFSWQDAPLSSKSSPFVAGALYLLTVLLLPSFVTSSCRQFATMWLPFHNGSLCLVSVVLFAGCLFESVCRLRKEGFVKTQKRRQLALCIFGLMPSTPGPQRKSLTWLESECAEVSKYVEFGDTFLLILKSGQRSKDFGLHLYHHALVPVITFFWLQYAMSLQFIGWLDECRLKFCKMTPQARRGVLWNTLVHVMMYAYFAFKEAGFDMPFSFVVWCLQVVQFLCSFPCGAMVLREIWDRVYFVF
eukprot:g22972.t1